MVWNADLSRANLTGARLRGATLAGADLTGADLQGVDLGGVDLTATNLSHADLSRTRLAGASLKEASVRGTNLRSTDLDEAQLGDTTFADCDLTEASGLASCHHHGPSSLDHRTIAKSGDLPLAFLRGVGLPDWLIETYRGYLASPIQVYSCCISYATADDLFAKRLHADLQDHGVRCWFAGEDLKIPEGQLGYDHHQAIDNEIRRRHKLLIALSETSITRPWVKWEVEEALDEEQRRGKPILFPIRLDDAILGATTGWATDVKRRFIGDFSAWETPAAYQEAFDRLLRDLKAETANEGD